MDKTQAIDTGRNLFWFGAQVVVIVFCVAFINFFYFGNILPDKQVKRTYQKSQCTLVQKQLSERGKLVHQYRSDFLLSYIFNGVQYQSIATGNGLDHSYTSNRVSQETILGQYQNGQAYDCWINPKEPEIVVLILRHSWTSTMPLVIPSVIGLIALYYFGRSVFAFLGVATAKTREIKIKRKKTKPPTA
jgi:hypothetical protein